MFSNQNRKVNQIIPSLVAGVLLIVIGVQLYSPVDPVGAACSPSSSSVSSSESSSVPNHTLAQELISCGKKSLFEEDLDNKHPDFKTEKKQGLEDFSTGNYQQAATDFKNALAHYANAPETLIYLNNALSLNSNKKTYTIAVVAPRTGNDQFIDLEILRGVAQAQDEINSSGGIKGALLKVVVANDNDQEGDARQIANYLAKDLEVLGVVGHSGTPTSMAAGPEYSSGELVAISPTSTAVNLSNFNPYVFRTAPSDYNTATKLAHYMVRNRQRKKAAVFLDYPNIYSQSLTKAFGEAVSSLGGFVLDQFRLSNSDFNAAQSVNWAISHGAEVLMLAPFKAPNNPTLDKALDVVHENQKRLSLLGGDEIYGCEFLQKGGPAAEGMVVAVPWHIKKNPQSEFVKKSFDLWKSDVNWRTALAYDATQALIAAIKLNPNNPKRSEIQKTLLSARFSLEGASGRIKFLDSGDRLDPPVQLMQISRISRNKGSCDSDYSFEPV